MNEKDVRFLTESPYLARAKIRALEFSGVKFIDSRNVYIGEDVMVGPGTVIWPGVILLGKTSVGSNCILWPDVSMYNAAIGDRVIVHRDNRIVWSCIGKECNIESYCLIKYARIAARCKVGPHAYIEGEKLDEKTLKRGRRSTHIGHSCVIGFNAHIAGRTIIPPFHELSRCEIIDSRELVPLPALTKSRRKRTKTPAP